MNLDQELGGLFGESQPEWWEEWSHGGLQSERLSVARLFFTLCLWAIWKLSPLLCLVVKLIRAKTCAMTPPGDFFMCHGLPQNIAASSQWGVETERGPGRDHVNFGHLALEPCRAHPLHYLCESLTGPTRPRTEKIDTPHTPLVGIW